MAAWPLKAETGVGVAKSGWDKDTIYSVAIQIEKDVNVAIED